MLTLTENACTIVKQMTDVPEATETAGLRITEAAEGFSVAAANGAAPGDQVVEQRGATVYLDTSASEKLDAMILDAGVDDTGAIQFGLLAQS